MSVFERILSRLGWLAFRIGLRCGTPIDELASEVMDKYPITASLMDKHEEFAR